MEITSLYFIFLSFLAIFIYYLINHRYRVILLMCLSCLFIASYSCYLLIYLIGYSFINYFIGLKIPTTKIPRVWYMIGILFNLIQIILLKYTSFFIEPIISIFCNNFHVIKLSEIIIPVGISYVTLQGIGYLVNVKMAWEKPEKNFLHFLLYIIFFPKFLSGPIERSNHFLPQLKINQIFNERQITEGLVIAFFGFFKKIAIANRLAPYLSIAYSDLNAIDGGSLWVLLLLQPLYLYFDFSGYTDIARGLARTFGIDLLPNFNRPFFSENMTTFWKRFHISLSSWFNDYIFRQASFKYRRWGIFASVYALFITWGLFGIWHGAGLNFMTLGLLQALAIFYEFFTKKVRLRIFSSLPKYISTCIGRAVTYLFYCGTLVFFFSPDLNSAIIYFSRLTEISDPDLFKPLSAQPFLVIIYIVLVLALELIKNDFQTIYIKLELYWSSDKKRIYRWILYSVLITLIVAASSNIEQFIYVNF